LNASGCAALDYLGCSDNQLTSLNASGCTTLEYLDCENNQLTATALNTVFTALPNRTGGGYAFIYISNNPGADTCDRAIAEDKGWRVY
jgi:hypothetical protein